MATEAGIGAQNNIVALLSRT